MSHSWAVPASTAVATPPGVALTTNVAVFDPELRAAGLKASTTAQLPLADKEPVQVFVEMTKSLALAPVRVAARPRVVPAATAPVFFMVRPVVVLVEPPVTAVANVKVAGSIANAAGPRPAPVSAAERLPPGLAVTCNVALFSPVEVGESRMDTLQVWFEDSFVVEQVLAVTPNSEDPATRAVRIPVSPVPVFVTTNVVAGLDWPTTMEPNGWEAGAMDNTPPTQVPALHWGVEGVAAQSVLEQHLSAAIQATPQVL